MRKVLLVCVLAVVLSGGIKANAAVASQGFHVCKISYVGSLFGKTLMALTSVDWTGEVWVIFDPTTEKNMLATALTARVADLPLRCWIMGDSVTHIMPCQTLYGIGLDLE